MKKRRALLKKAACLFADEAAVFHTLTSESIGFTLHLAPKRSWQAADQRCQQDGQDLVRLYSRPQGAKLASAVAEFTKEPFWIGLTDRSIEGSWVWSVDGKAPRINSSWAPGQPDGERDENCAVASADGGAWMDVPCDEHFAFVCMGDAASLAAAAAVKERN